MAERKPLIPDSEQIKKFFSGDLGIADKIQAPLKEKLSAQAKTPQDLEILTRPDPPKTGLKSIEQSIISTMIESQKPIAEIGRLLLDVCAGSEDVIARLTQTVNPKWLEGSFSFNKIASVTDINGMENVYQLPSSDPVKEENQVLPSKVMIGLLDNKGDYVIPVPQNIESTPFWYGEFDIIKSPQELYTKRVSQLDESFEGVTKPEVLELKPSVLANYDATQEYNSRLSKETQYHTETERIINKLRDANTVEKGIRRGRLTLDSTTDVFSVLPSLNGQNTQLDIESSYSRQVDMEEDPELYANLKAQNERGIQFIEDQFKQYKLDVRRGLPSDYILSDDPQKLQLALNDDVRRKLLLLIAGIEGIDENNQSSLELGTIVSVNNAFTNSFREVDFSIKDVEKDPFSFGGFGNGYSSAQTVENLLGISSFEYKRMNLVNAFYEYMNGIYNQSVEILKKQFFDTKTIILDDQEQVFDVDADYTLVCRPMFVTFKLNENYRVPINYFFIWEAVILEEPDDTSPKTSSTSGSNNKPSKGPRIYKKKHIPTAVTVFFSKVIKKLIDSIVKVIDSISKLTSPEGVVAFLWSILEKKLEEFVHLFDDDIKKDRYAERIDKKSNKPKRQFLESGYAEINLGVLQFGILIDNDGKPSIFKPDKLESIKEEYNIQPTLQKIANFVSTPINFMVELFMKLIEIIKKFFSIDSLPSAFSELTTFKWATENLNPTKLLEFVGTKFHTAKDKIAELRATMKEEQDALQSESSRYADTKKNRDNDFNKKIRDLQAKQAKLTEDIQKGVSDFKADIFEILNKMKTGINDKLDYEGPLIKSPLFSTTATPGQGKNDAASVICSFKFISDFMNAFITMPISILGLDFLEPSIPKFPEIPDPESIVSVPEPPSLNSLVPSNS